MARPRFLFARAVASILLSSADQERPACRPALPAPSND
jgi:hypothetical protein